MDTALANGGPAWHIVNAGQSMDEVEAAIWAIVEPLLTTVGPTPVGKLWMDEPTTAVVAAAGKDGDDDDDDGKEITHTPEATV
jgi:hypothetical protein